MDELCDIVDEKNKLIKISQHNIETLDKFKKMLSIIDQIEQGLTHRSSGYIHRLNELDQCVQDNINLFRSICMNLT